MKEDGSIIQPNHISTARFKVSIIEKNIIYVILDKLQNRMNKDLNQVYNQKEIIDVIIEMKKVDKNGNYRQILNAIKTLGSKHVEYELQIPQTKRIIETSTSLVSGVQHEKYSEFISVKVPPDAYKFFCYIGGGFTSFQKVIAISLNSIYSKLMYELCNRWVDKGGYSTSIIELKKYLNTGEKYKQIAHLRNKVLDTTIKELKRKADLFFSYTLIKTGRKYTHIKIKIHRNTSDQNSGFIGVKAEQYTYVYGFLSKFFPNYVDNKALHYTELLAKYELIQRADGRFKRLNEELNSGQKTMKDAYSLLLHVILPEFGIKTKPKKPNHT